MVLAVNRRHLEAHNVRLAGQLPIDLLDIDTKDEMIKLGQPLEYDLEIQKLDGGLLAQGQLRLKLECQCVRCLKPFAFLLELRDWSRHVPLQGEEAAPVINDCVDLTPYVREDILLEFPQHPLCNPECRGLPERKSGKTTTSASGTGKTDTGSSAWAELNKLKF